MKLELRKFHQLIKSKKNTEKYAAGSKPKR